MGATCCSPCPKNDDSVSGARLVQALDDDNGDDDLHPAQAAIDGKPESVLFIPWSELEELTLPYRRRQDISPVPVTARSHDKIVCVSHAWPYQTHPDPTTEKAQCIKDLLQEIKDKEATNVDPLVFLDYLSVTQRPRTADETELFQDALRAMPMIYLRADAVIHIDKDFSLLPVGKEVTVKAEVLSRSRVGLRAVGNVIQLAGTPAGQNEMQENDIVVSVNNCEVKSLEHANQLMKQGGSVVVRKAPFGVRNEVPAGRRGWIYLERFCSMVKLAMVNKDDREKAVFSNNPAVLEEIYAGSDKLRNAAQEGSKQLHNALSEFQEELKKKSFSTASTCILERHNSKSGNVEEAVDEDARTVFEIMDTCVAYLREYWAEETRRHVQRELHSRLSCMVDDLHLSSAMEGVETESANPVELIYFPLIGRGEYIILICLENDIPMRMPKFTGEFGPTGTIPNIKHGEVELWDSTAIVQYLLEQFPGPCSPPANLRIKALDFWAVLQDYYNFVLSPMHDIIMGLPKRNLRLTDACRACGAPTLSMDGIDIMISKLIDLHIQRTTYLEEILVKRGSPEYICGVFTYVDLMMYTFVTAVDKFKGFKIFRDTFKTVTKKETCWEQCPTIRKICDRVAQRPKVAARFSRYEPCDL